ncbi:hypothetical protein ZEAMMB73_Zm00001d034512 [Zea mays]|uniref:Uncharacterized protein n=1 Tax=Zea mays TaxID=4577 RepID=A0A1D6L883_MAIZE|nr:hypothetical protein ZEAMMB73_Zm00001d034512 [Zea mays]
MPSPPRPLASLCRARLVLFLVPALLLLLPSTARRRQPRAARGTNRRGRLASARSSWPRPCRCATAAGSTGSTGCARPRDTVELFHSACGRLGQQEQEAAQHGEDNFQG